MKITKIDVDLSRESVKMRSRKLRGEGVDFERLRRITGYLVGSLERWNDGKKAEEHDRVKHDYGGVEVEIKRIV